MEKGACHKEINTGRVQVHADRHGREKGPEGGVFNLRMGGNNGVRGMDRAQRAIQLIHLEFNGLSVRDMLHFCALIASSRVTLPAFHPMGGRVSFKAKPLGHRCRRHQKVWTSLISPSILLTEARCANRLLLPLLLPGIQPAKC